MRYATGYTTTNWDRMALYGMPAPKAAPAPPVLVKRVAAKPAGKAAAMDARLAARFALAARFSTWAAKGKVATS